MNNVCYGNTSHNIARKKIHYALPIFNIYNCVHLSDQGAFEVDFTLATCSAGADGCLDEAQLAAQEPELEQQIKALEASGLSVNDVYACTCSGDLCNSALNIATNPVVVFFSMMVVILQAFFFS